MLNRDQGLETKLLSRILFLCFSLVIICCVYKLWSTPGGSGAADAQERGPLPVVSDPKRANPSEDATRPYGQYDGRGGYLVTWLTGSNYAGYGGTDQVLSRVSVSRPTAMEPLSTIRAPDSQEETVIAVGRGQSLVVWQDLRNGKDYDVYGARVADDGRLLDAEGFLIAGGPGNQINPTVVFDGNEFLVAWAQFEGVKYVVRSAKISSAAQVSPATLEAASSERHCVRPMLLKTKNGVWLFWAEVRSNNRLMAKQLSTAQSSPIVVMDSLFAGKFVAVSDGGRYILVARSIVQGKFYDQADVLGTIWDAENRRVVPIDGGTSKIFYRIGSGLKPGVLWIEDGSEASRKRQFDGNIRGLQVAWDGKSFVAVWSTVIFPQSGPSVGRPTNHLILTRRIDPASGSFLGAEPKVVVQSPRALRNPYLISDGKGQLVLFYDTENEQGRKLIQAIAL
jgi:hypothetical protein